MSSELHYRVMNIAVGDLGAPAAKKYDIEVWLPGQGRYRELTSCSNTTDYQARRLDARYRDERGRAPPPHAERHGGHIVAHPHRGARDAPEERRQRGHPRDPARLRRPARDPGTVRSPDGANGEREAEREQHVAEDGDAFEVEDVRRHPSVQMIEGSPPPRHQHGHRQGGEQRGGDGDAELADKPAPARDALRPGKAERAVLELEDERCRQQNADRAWDQVEPRKQAVDASELVAERRHRLVTGRGLVRLAGREPVVPVCRGHAHARRYEQRGKEAEDCRRNQRLAALLAPGDPDHDATTWREDVRCAAAALS